MYFLWILLGVWVAIRPAASPGYGQSQAGLISRVLTITIHFRELIALLITTPEAVVVVVVVVVVVGSCGSCSSSSSSSCSSCSCSSRPKSWHRLGHRFPLSTVQEEARGIETDLRSQQYSINSYEI